MALAVEDLERQLQYAIRKYKNHETAAESYRLGASAAAERYALALISEAGYQTWFSSRDRITIDFADGSEAVEFEKVIVSEYQSEPQIALRHFTKKGKPMKHPTWYDLSILRQLAKKPKD